MDKIEALVIVAHPDDETIWMGGTILRNSNWKWTILSLCRADDSDRKPKFDKACRIYNAKALIANLDDEILRPIKTDEIKEVIKSVLPRNNFDIIFTHGENGEYGHIRHAEIHNAVKSMIKNKDLVSKKVYFFNYTKGENIPYPNLKTPQPIEHSDFVLNLSDKEQELKRKIIREIYKYPNEKGFELMSCNKMEAFELMK